MRLAFTPFGTGVINLDRAQERAVLAYVFPLGNSIDPDFRYHTRPIDATALPVSAG